MAATMHENLIATMALRAAQMESLGCFTLPSGNTGEDRIADFCSDKVREYEEGRSDEPFDLFIEEALQAEYGKEQNAPEHHKKLRGREER